MKTENHKMKVNDHWVYTEKYVFDAKFSTSEYQGEFDEEALIERLKHDIEDQILHYAQQIQERRDMV